MTPSKDIHTETYKKDKDFHRFMDILHPGWQEWPDGKKCMAAKQFNFGRMYGNTNAVKGAQK